LANYEKLRGDFGVGIEKTRISQRKRIFLTGRERRPLKKQLACDSLLVAAAQRLMVFLWPDSHRPKKRALAVLCELCASSEAGGEYIFTFEDGFNLTDTNKKRGSTTPRLKQPKLSCGSLLFSHSKPSQHSQQSQRS
jgi:hypothetical protein